ncbi:hypothetical protein C2869_16905 [Saccharobesus litoralis]|uniref:Serine protease n=1 Tax=Saccharobesus litoralis TaxID=2172099 RepID=A0A2S0VUW1_9ALTE|nr:serine protease [Saccharobesus litoralis]AWB67999.1 hypothetical protein C2869_16905 [Saccharobesus litoralis]
MNKTQLSRLALIIVCALWMTFTKNLKAHAQTTAHCSQLPSEVSPSIVRLELSATNQASAIVIKHDTLLTVAHALPLGKAIKVYIKPEYTATASIIAIHHGLDLAILKVDTQDLTPIPLTDSHLQFKERVWAAGFANRDWLNVTSGFFVKKNYKGLISSASIEAGSSGGALLHCGNKGLELAGVLHAYKARYEQGKLMNTGYSIAVPTEQFLSFIEQNT